MDASDRDAAGAAGASGGAGAAGPAADALFQRILDCLSGGRAMCRVEEGSASFWRVRLLEHDAAARTAKVYFIEGRGWGEEGRSEPFELDLDQLERRVWLGSYKVRRQGARIDVLSLPGSIASGWRRKRAGGVGAASASPDRTAQCKQSPPCRRPPKEPPKYIHMHSPPVRGLASAEERRPVYSRDAAAVPAHAPRRGRCYTRG
jgi:hypothetical protein